MEKKLSSGMNLEEAKKIADEMTFSQAVSNCLNAKGIPFKKATKLKINQLLAMGNCYDQNKWERDIALEQLNELGFSFGEKVSYKPKDVNERELKSNGIWDWTCERCGSHYRNDYQLNFCNKCGAKFNWSDWS